MNFNDLSKFEHLQSTNLSFDQTVKIHNNKVEILKETQTVSESAN